MTTEKELPKCVACGVPLACPCCEASQLNECVECGNQKWCITCDEDEVREIIEPLPRRAAAERRVVGQRGDRRISRMIGWCKASFLKDTSAGRRISARYFSEAMRSVQSENVVLWLTPRVLMLRESEELRSIVCLIKRDA